MIAALILARGAAEGYANWVHIQAGIPAKGRWVERWMNLPAAARALGRPAQAEADGADTGGDGGQFRAGDEDRVQAGLVGVGEPVRAGHDPAGDGPGFGQGRGGSKDGRVSALRAR